MAASTVTIDKGYFEDLLRKAQLDPGGLDYTSPIDLPTVNIPRVDHANLLRIAQEYSCLRKSLLQGGIAAETLDILIAGPGFADNVSTPGAPPGLSYGQSPDVPSYDRPMRKITNIQRPSFSQSPEWRHGPSTASALLSKARPFGNRLEGTGSFLVGKGQDQSRDNSEFEYDDEDVYESPGAVKPHFYGNNTDQRSLVFSNLAPTTTHKELATAVRGGQILDMYFRPGRDFAANVAFVEGSAAKAFLEYVKRNDLYIKGRRIEVGWNERQFVLQGHVASRIANNGATRNLRIAHISPQITAEKIRDDLEHIHNLVVVDLTFDVAGSALVSLNSVMAAFIAKQCLSSRVEYKTPVKISFSPDDCDQPLPAAKPRYNTGSLPRRLVKKASVATLNPFQALNMADDGSESDESDITTTTVGQGGVAISN